MNPVYETGAYGDLSNMVYADVMDRARACFTATERDKAALSSPEAVHAWQQRMKQAFMDAIGGLPEETCDLAPVWGALREREGYSVQNVMFLAAPNVPVTATVWRPVGWEGSRPGVLFPCGHHEYPREAEEYQLTCTWFALNGYVTLAFDPPGQGERKLCWDPVLQRSFAGTGSAEHEHCGRQCELIGHNIARYFVRDGMRAFDLLATLPGVDAARIAVTGNSGGGTQSSYLMISDDRLAAGMPCTFTTDRQIYMGRTHWHDAEQNLTGAIPAGLDYEDFYAVMAPKPTAIGAVTWDFFPIEGTRRAFKRLQRLYRALGSEERVALFESEGAHHYDAFLRRHAIEWFNRWLQPEAQFRQPESFTPEPPETMRNTASGQISVSVPDACGVFEQNRNEVLKMTARRADVHVRRPESGCGQPPYAQLGLPETPCPLNPRILTIEEQEGLRVEKGFIVSQTGHEADIMTVVPWLRLGPEDAERVMLYCCDGGIESIGATREMLLRTIARTGVAIYVAEPRGVGETRSRTLSVWDPGWLTETWLSQYLRMLGTSLGALRAYDLSRLLEYARGPGGASVGVMAEGFVGWAAVLAAVLDGQVGGLCLDQVPPCIEEFATTWTANPPEAYTLPGILKMGDVPDLVTACTSGFQPRVLLLNPRDAHGNAVADETWHKQYAAGWRTVSPLQVSCMADEVQANALIADFWKTP